MKSTIKLNEIAPCGMNCAICIANLRDKNRCPGCNSKEEDKSKYCRQCSVVICPLRKQSKVKFCYACVKFPCARIKQLDKRYRAKYGMSMVDNLRAIQQIGIRRFAAQEGIRWQCSRCGERLCVHRDACPVCGAKRKELAKGKTRPMRLK